MRIRLLFRSLSFALGTGLSLFRHDAMADPIAYAEHDFDYVRIDFGAGTTETIGPLAQLMLIGAFADNDFSKEYAIDYPSADLYSIDVATAETTLVGNTGMAASVPSGMQWDPASNAMDLLVPDVECSSVTLYLLDIGTGATQQIGVSEGCLFGLAFDADDKAFSIDFVADTLVRLDVGPIGPLGFDVGYVSALFFDPSDGILFLIAEDVDTALNGIYTVNTTTGNATFVAANPDQYSAFALTNPGSDPDRVFCERL